MSASPEAPIAVKSLARRDRNATLHRPSIDQEYGTPRPVLDSLSGSVIVVLVCIRNGESHTELVTLRIGHHDMVIQELLQNPTTCFDELIDLHGQLTPLFVDVPVASHSNVEMKSRVRWTDSQRSRQLWTGTCKSASGKDRDGHIGRRT